MATREMPDPEELKKSMPSNSMKSKQVKKSDPDSDISNNTKKKEVRQVAKAKVRKQSLLKRIGKSILEDSIETAKDKAYNDIIVPGIKTILFDTATDMLSTVLFGESESNSRSSQKRYSSRRREDRTSYSDYYDKQSKGGHRTSERGNRIIEPDDIILDTRQDAAEVLDELDFIIRKYGQASIADFYDIVGVTSHNWPDNAYGWISLRGASIKPVRDGYMLVMPRTHLLDD